MTNFGYSFLVHESIMRYKTKRSIEMTVVPIQLLNMRVHNPTLCLKFSDVTPKSTLVSGHRSHRSQLTSPLPMFDVMHRRSTCCKGLCPCCDRNYLVSKYHLSITKPFSSHVPPVLTRPSLYRDDVVHRPLLPTQPPNWSHRSSPHHH